MPIEKTREQFCDAAVSAVIEASSHITADYWGYARDRIKQHYNSDIKVLGLCRAAGELSPHRLFARDMSAEDGVGAAERLGLWIADNIIFHEEKSDRINVTNYASVTKEISFPIRKITEDEYNWAKAHTDDKGNYNELGKAVQWDVESNARHMVKFYENKISSYSAKVSVIRIGRLYFLQHPRSFLQNMQSVLLQNFLKILFLTFS